MHPSGNLPKGLTSKRYVNFTPLPPALNQPGSFQKFQVLGHSVESRGEGLSYI